MPGRTKLQAFKGTSGIAYCPYCNVKAIAGANHHYCPVSVPHNMRFSRDRPRLPIPYDPGNLPKRTSQQIRENGQLAVELGGPGSDIAFETGVNGLCLLGNGLEGIDMALSFPPDIMHLLWENIIPALVRHWRGGFHQCPELRHVSERASENKRTIIRPVRRDGKPRNTS